MSRPIADQEPALLAAGPRALAIAIMALPDPKRTAFIRRARGDSYREIAEGFGVPVTTVNNWIHRARVALRKRLAAHGPAP